MRARRITLWVENDSAGVGIVPVREFGITPATLHYFALATRLAVPAKRRKMRVKITHAGDGEGSQFYMAYRAAANLGGIIGYVTAIQRVRLSDGVPGRVIGRVCVSWLNKLGIFEGEYFNAEFSWV